MHCPRRSRTRDVRASPPHVPHSRTAGAQLPDRPHRVFVEHQEHHPCTSLRYCYSSAGFAMAAAATEGPGSVNEADRSVRVAVTVRSANIAAQIRMPNLLHVTIPPCGAGMTATMCTEPLMMMNMMLGGVVTGSALLAVATSRRRSHNGGQPSTTRRCACRHRPPVRRPPRNRIPGGWRSR